MGAMHARGLTGAPLRAALAVVLVCVAGAGAACGSTITPPRVVSDADNGHSVTVRRGAIIRLVLHSTYWRPHGSSAPSVVAVSGAPKYVAQSGGIAGSGNGTVTETLRALTAGLRGARTEGPMAPEIPLAGQRPAQYVFSRHVERKLAEIRTRAHAQMPPAA